jgi:hypothetical protein
MSIQIEYHIIRFDSDGSKEAKIVLVNWIIRIAGVIPVVIIGTRSKINVFGQNICSRSRNTIGSNSKV